MPTCPECDFEAESVTDFVYKVGVGAEGFGIDGEPLSTYLVCPRCDVVLGSPNTKSDL